MKESLIRQSVLTGEGLLVSKRGKTVNNVIFPKALSRLEKDRKEPLYFDDSVPSPVSRRSAHFVAVSFAKG